MKPLSETARETGAKVNEIAQKTAENAKAGAEAAKQRLQDGYDRARTATSDLAALSREQAEVAREAAEQALEKGKAQAKRANGKLKSMAEQQPMALLAGAVALGALFGSLLPRRKAQEEQADEEEF
ncbi:MAG: hypothetical protein CVT74_10780 [Alphaproteobacteria bacterium HGW-Alphaproteobacteria-13]|jgi:hypothetical protein|nr:MAG: hypothetical protein CVT74_10780 [Alphaproteobacteria bacterium HGW-Alphaproteobacteria-13]